MTFYATFENPITKNRNIEKLAATSWGGAVLETQQIIDRVADYFITIRLIQLNAEE